MSGTPPPEPLLGPLPRTALTLGLFSALSVAFTWPLATDPGGLSIAVHFDHLAMSWLISAAETFGPGSPSPLAAWPVGQPTERLDSNLLLLLSWIVGRAVDPWLVIGLLSLVGPVLSAWAAERLAARLGAGFPWSLLAGVVYGFSGLMATAALEGHSYMMLAPWLPLLALSLMQATTGAAQVRDGLLAGLWWSLCLLTTAYMGVVATLLVLGLLVRALVLRSLPARSLGAAAAVALPVGLLYIAAFALGDSPGAWGVGGSVEAMEMGSARLATLTATSGFTDMHLHSMAPVLPKVALALCLFAPVVLAGQRGWRTLLLLAGVGAALSLGPTLQLDGPDLAPAWLLYPLTLVDGAASFFRFPSRLSWLTTLGLGVVGARVLSVLAARVAWHPAALLAAAAGEALIATGVPDRGVAVPVATPSAYAQAPEGRAILELVPRFYQHGQDLPLYINGLHCSYQADHGRPLLNLCITTRPIDNSPQWAVGTWLMSALLETGEDEVADPAMADRLAALGIGAVALHPDLFEEAQREDIADGLAALLGDPVAESTDGGEAVVLYEVPGVVSERAAAVAAWRDFAGE